jgi:hypothetical protein
LLVLQHAPNTGWPFKNWKKQVLVRIEVIEFETWKMQFWGSCYFSENYFNEYSIFFFFVIDYSRDHDQGAKYIL